MKEITYKISIGEYGKFVEQQEVKGFLAFELYGYQWGAHKEVEEDGDSFFDRWVITELSTGFQLEFGIAFTRVEAVDRAYSYLIKKGEVMTKFHIERAKDVIAQGV